MAARFVKSELTSAMKAYVDNVAESLIEQKASLPGFRDGAHDTARRFLPTSASDTAFKEMEKSILEYMIEEGYVSKQVLKVGYIDSNGMEVANPKTPLPTELVERRYGCRIDYTESDNVEEAYETLLDQGFIAISAYKLREPGVLYPNKFDFFAHEDKDCSQWAKEALEDYPEFRVGKTFNVVWDQYYNIQVTTENLDKVITYHKLK